jgi:hypothetical protein
MTLNGPPKPAQETVPTVKTPEYWQENLPFKSPRKLYELEFEFAKLMAKRTGIPLLEAVDTYASVIQNHIHTFIEEGEWEITGLEEGVTDENMLEHAWTRSLERHVERNSTPTVYHEENGSRFGCHYCNVNENDPKVIDMHFFNAEFEEEWVDDKDVSKGPLATEKVSRRMHELTDMFTDIKRRYPHAERVRCQTWLNGFEPFLRLFPESYRENAKQSPVDYDKKLWSKGTTLWGQFLGGNEKVKGQYGFREELAKEFMENAKEVPTETIEDALPYPPRTAEADIQDFYRLYSI